MSLALLPESSAVAVALEHLELIGQQFEKDELGDREVMWHLTATIDAIKELEAIRRSTLEQLEMVTIENSKLRFSVGQLPEKITEEIAASILAARESNAVQMNQLQAELKNIREEMECLQKKEHDLQTQNAFLGLQAKELWEEHEQAVDHLNQQMAMKAQESITLNEIYNKVKDLKEEIGIIMENTISLKEELDEEKKRFEEEYYNLNEEIAELHMDIEVQNKQNVEKQDYIDELTAAHSDIESKVRSEKEMVFQLMDKREQLQATCTKLKDLINEQKKTLEIFSAKKKDLELKLLVLEENFSNLKMAQEAKIAKMTDRLIKAENVNKHLTKRNSSLSELYQSLREEEEKMLAIKLHFTNQLENISTDLSTKVELLAKMKQEIKETEEETVKFRENSLVQIMACEEDLQEHKGNLSKEKSKRISLQTKSNELEKQVGFWKTAKKKIIHEMNERIEAGTKRYNELNDERMSIQEEFLHLDEDTELIRKEYSKAEDEYKAIEQNLRYEIKLLEEQLNSNKKTLNHDETLLEEKLPVLQNLQNKFAEESKNLEEMKNYVRGLTQKQKSLEYSTNTKKKALVKLSKVKEENTAELKERRAAVLIQIQKQTDDLMALEKDIYEVSRKLELAQMENGRLKICSVQMRENISEEFKEAKRHMTAITKIQKELKTFSECLLLGWEEDRAVHKDFSERDQETLDAMKELIRNIQERKEKIGDFSDKMQEKCDRLSSVLERKANIKLEITDEAQ
ncbi:coiled-coil domain-containing protein 175 [Microcaecilia unicolor]|uniref:Myosin heavy chain, non-muscle-like n=1 Tax=Microcaecilia unicolor TaxID=1415580 RepID=A0A6P7Z103_9AMPH|nr:myosin heavy chain, non-muscle-like [Microcaecilia unicolor]